MISAANRFFWMGEPFAGPNFWGQIEMGLSHYKIAAEVLENPLYEPSVDEIETVQRFEKLMETVDEYLSVGFEPLDY